MDIPDTGAIFTLGKSYLAENTQSYFFIKNDPVKNAVTGPSQSAVICESGRLFVWGENLYGQLGIGNSNNNDIVTKPTCVKSLKLLGLKVQDISFGIGWAVILTHSNEIYFTGRNIFPRTSKIFKNFQEYRVHGEKQSLIKKPIKLINFDENILNNNDNENDIELFKKCYAGNDHFILETSHGRLFGWGSNDSNQLGLISEIDPSEPIEVKLDLKISKIVCGPKSTLILSDLNKLYLCGHLNESNFSELTELIGPQDAASTTISFIYISRSNEIFIINEFGGIYRSSESTRKKLHFQKFYDYDHDEYGPVWKLLKGSSFYIALTKSHKFFTTFSESGHHLKTFREISKFKNLKVLDAAIGDRHILVLGVQKGVRKKLSEKSITGGSLNKTYSIGSNAVKIKNVSNEKLFKDKLSKEKNDIDETNYIDENNDLNGNKTEVIKPNTPASDDHKTDNLEILNEEDENSNEEFKQNENESLITKTENNGLEKVETDVNDTNGNVEKNEKTDDDVENNKLKENLPGENLTEDPIFEAQKTLESKFADNENNLEMSYEQNFVEETVQKEKDSQNSTEEKVLDRNELTTAEIDDVVEKSAALTHTLNGSTDKLNNSENEPINAEINSIIHEEPPPSIEDIREELVEKASSEITKDVLNETNRSESFDEENFSNDVFNKDSLPLKHLPPLKSLSKTSFNNLSVSPSVKFDQNSIKSEKSAEYKIRPRTPYPSDSSTPQTVKRKQRKFSEVNNPEEDLIEHTSMSFSDSLEASPSEKTSTGTKAPNGNHEIEEIIQKSSPNSKYTIKQRFSSIKNNLEDELEIEVEHNEDLLNKTVVEEIRFINDGIDVTEKVTKTLHNRTISKIDNFNANLNVLQKNAKNLTQMNVDYETPDDSEESTKNKSSTINDGIEDDERTTASVNSNKNDVEEKKDFYNEIKDDVIEVGGKGKKTVKRFINGIKNTGKGMSCRNHKSLKVEDDPPEYTPVDEHLEDLEADNTRNTKTTSKVCTIL